MIDYVRRNRRHERDTAPATPTAPRAPLAMCPACGTDVTPSDPTCAACGERSLALPALAMWAVGGVHRVRRGLRTRAALCVDADRASLTLLLPDDTSMTVEPTHPVVEPPLPREAFAGLRSSPGLLLRFARDSGGTDVPWSGDTLIRAAIDHARRDRVLGRLVALDAVALGRSDLLPHLGVSESETRWIAAVDVARRGELDALLAHVEALPHGHYARISELFAAVLPPLRSRLDLRARVDGVLRAHPGPLAPAVARALELAAASDRTRVDDAAARARLLPASDLRDQLLSLLEEQHPTPRPPSELGPASHRLFLRRHPASARRGGAPQPDDLVNLPVDDLDDLVDAGVVDPQVALGLPAGRARSHLVARLAPNRLDETELDPHPAERDRRRLLAGEVPTTRGPWASLAALRSGRWEDVVVDDVDEGDRAAVRRLLDAETRPGALLDDDVLADRTLWPAIAARLGDSRAVLGPKPRRRAPEFCAWLDVHRALGRLRAGDLDRADTVAGWAHDAPTPELRREAHAVRAAVARARGDVDAALTELETALIDGPTESLLARIELYARDLAPEWAAERLLAIGRGLPDVDRAALTLRTLSLWLDMSIPWQGDGMNRVVSPPLREALRHAVDAPISREDFLLVLRVLAPRDGPWLLSHGLSRSPHRGTLEAGFGLACADAHTGLLDFFADPPTNPPRWWHAELDAFCAALLPVVAEFFQSDDPPDHEVDFLWAAATRLPFPTVQWRHRYGYLALALVTGRAINRRRTTPPAGALELWRNLRAHGDVDPDLPALVSAEELATRRLGLLETGVLVTRARSAVDDYNEWLERLQRTVQYQPQAMDVFQASVDTLEGIRDELRMWRGVNDDSDYRDVVGQRLEYVGSAIPHIQRMIMPKLKMFE